MNKNKRNINDLAYLIPISALLLVVASQSIAHKQFILSDFKLIEIKIFIETLISGFLDQRTSLILQSTPFRIYWTASYTLCFIFGTLALIYCVVTFRDVLFEKK